MTNLKERIARAIYAEECNQWDIQADEAEIVPMKHCAYDDCDKQEKRAYEAFAQAVLEAMLDCGELWDGLPRQLMFWQDFADKSPRALFKHLERSGYEIPQWLRDEPEMQSLGHTPSKGTRAVLVYKAFIKAAIAER